MALPGRDTADQQAQDDRGATRLLATLEQLLAIDFSDLRLSLNRASDLVAESINAEKVDIFLYAAELDALVAMGISDTPLARREKELGLNVLTLAGGGHSVATFKTQQSFLSRDVENDPDEVVGIKRDLGVRSLADVPLYVAGELRGVLQVDSVRSGAFSAADLRFLEAVAGWIGALIHRIELVEQQQHDALAVARRATAEQLITIIAHDLGNYITPLTGRLDLIQRRATREHNAAMLEDATEMSAALARLTALTYNLLDAGRLEQDIFTLHKRSFDLAALVGLTVAAMKTVRVPINAQAPAELQLTGDPDRLRQALENLLANAIKYSPPGATVEVELTAEKQDAHGWATIIVRDQGPGIAPELQQFIFERFSAGSGSPGLGLGLYLAQGIAHAHGGSISVDSAPGAGASFILDLPLSEQNNTATT